MNEHQQGMNLRSGAITKEFFKAKREESGKSTKHLIHAAPEMAEGIEIKQLINELKNSLTTEIKDFRSEFEELRVQRRMKGNK